MLHLATKEAVPSKAIFPAQILFLGMPVAAYRPNLPQFPNVIWAAAFSSFFAAIWPFQLKRVLWSPGERSQIKYQRIGSGSSSNANSPESSDSLKSLHLLQQTVLIAVIILTPLLLFSGELSHISRNCYFLRVPRFWIFLFGGGAFRSVLLISSALFIMSTSALSFIIFIVLVEVSQVALLTYSKLLFSQWLALALCLPTGSWVYWLNLSSSTTSTATSENPGDSEESRKCRGSFQKDIVQSAIRVAALIILMSGCIQILSKHGPQPISSEKSPISYSRGTPILGILRGTDAYLGQRPNISAVADLPMLIEECRGTYEHLENIYDINRCLDYLSTKQDKYLSTPVHMAGHLHAHLHKNTESDSIILDHSNIVTVTDNSNSITDKCKGPIIPYHIWWTGLPTWRIELFIKSYFYTQNLACSKLWIWVNTDHHPGAMDAWLRYPRFQRFMPLVFCGDIILKEWKLPPRVPLPPNLDELDSARYYTHHGTPTAPGERLVADSIVRDSTGQEWVQIYRDGDEP